MADFSFIQYNGVKLNIIRTDEYEQTPVFSDDGSDYLYTRFTVSVTAVYNPEAISYQAGNPPTATAGILAPDTMQALEYVMMQPRKFLIYSFHGTALISSPEDPNVTPSVDALNGPTPLFCRVSSLAGTKTWLVSFSVVTHVLDCPDQLSNSTPIISNRYSVTHDMDERFFTTIISSGEAIVATDQLNNRTIDQFRSKCLPPIPAYFRRASISVTVNPIGNRLAWQTRDVEVSYALGDNTGKGGFIGGGGGPLSGIVDFTARISAGSVSAGGMGMPAMHQVVAFDCTARGNRLSSRDNLVTFCMSLAATKLRLPSGGAKGPPVLMNARIAEDLHDPVVSIHIETWNGPTEAAAPGGGPIDLNWFGTDTQRSKALIHRDGGLNPSPNADGISRGTYTVPMFVQALQDACQAVPSPGSGGAAGAGAGAPQGGGGGGAGALGANQSAPVVTVGLSETRPTYATKYTSTWFTQYQLDIKYIRDEHRIMMPSTGPATGPGSPGPAAAYPQVANPTMRVVVAFTAERLGSKPICPDPFINNTNYVMMGRQFQPAANVILPDSQTPGFRASGVYEYGLLRPLGNLDNFPAGAMPWVTTTYGDGDANYTPGDFTQGIIGPLGGGGGTSPPPKGGY